MMPHGIKLKQAGNMRWEAEIRELPDSGEPPAASFAPCRRQPDASKILAAAEQAGICDETDGAPLREKLAALAKRKPDVLAALCFDDDPVCRSEELFLRENAAKIADGLELAAKACRAGKTVAAVPCREIRRFPPAGFAVPAVAAGRRYPARFFLLQKLRRGGKTVSCIGAQACAALADAVREGIPQSGTVVTVAGSGIPRGGCFRVRIGTPLGEVLKAAGAAPRSRFLSVGPAMTGRSVSDLTMPVTAATRCVLVEKRAPRVRTFPCVKCGRCVTACPVGVVPWLVHRELENGEPDSTLLFHVGDCIGCRACDAVCPSGISLAEEAERAAAFKEGRRSL